MTNRFIGQPLPFDALDRGMRAGGITHAELFAVIIAEIELGEIAMQMLLVAMLVHAEHAALEDTEIVFDRVCCDKPVTFIANVLIGLVVDSLMVRKIGAEAAVVAAFVRHHLGFFGNVIQENRLTSATAVISRRSSLDLSAERNWSKIKHKIGSLKNKPGISEGEYFMFDSNIKRNRAAFAGGNALGFVLAMGLGLPACPAEAAPFAYVTNESSNTVSVIDTATNTVAEALTVGSGPVGVAVAPDGKHAYVTNFDNNSVSVIDTTANTVEAATLTVGTNPVGVAVTPDGKHAYVANEFGNTVSVIDTATNTVETATIPVGFAPFGVAVAPDGKHAYVTNLGSNSVSVIDTATNTVEMATIPVGNGPFGVAVAPDGKHAYVTNDNPTSVSVIDTATNTVEAAALAVGTGPTGVAVTPDGKHAYVANFGSNSVSVIDTATNTVEAATLAVGSLPTGVAVTPDGKHAYVTNSGSNSVSVIDTATNTVEAATLAVGTGPQQLGIVPPPPGVPFLAFNAVLNIHFGSAPNTDAFTFGSSFTLSSTAPAINPVTQAVTLQAGTFAVTIPPGSFNENTKGVFFFEGVINSVTLKAVIKSTGTLRYAFQAEAQGASFTGTQNTVYVTLAIGGGSFSNSNSGATSVTAAISGAAPPVKAAMSR